MAFKDYLTRREYLQYREDMRNEKHEMAWRRLHIDRVRSNQKLREPWYRNPIWYTLDSLSDGECVFLMMFVAVIFYIFKFFVI